GARRTQLTEEKRSIIETGKRALGALEAQDRREGERLEQLNRRIRQRGEDDSKRRQGLNEQRARLEATLQVSGVIERAGRRLGLAESAVVKREERVAGLRRVGERLEKLRADGKLARERIAGIEREAGQASLKAQELSRRLALTAEVPCVGTDLQGRCTTAARPQRKRPSGTRSRRRGRRLSRSARAKRSASATRWAAWMRRSQRCRRLSTRPRSNAHSAARRKHSARWSRPRRLT